jgi:hypothetical protein
VTVPVNLHPSWHPSQGAPVPEKGVGSEEIDQVLQTWSDQRRAFAARQAQTEATHILFVGQADEIADHVIRPAMEATLARLARGGGGGRIEECSGDDTHSLRLIPWMALEGDIPGAPHDRTHPYLQLDIDVATRRIDVSEGDRWEKEGFGRALTRWQLGEITAQSVTKRVIEILQCATGHNVET